MENSDFDIKNLFDDFQEMPDCSEKFIVKFIHDCSVEPVNKDELMTNLQIIDDRFKREDIVNRNYWRYLDEMRKFLISLTLIKQD